MRRGTKLFLFSALAIIILTSLVVFTTGQGGGGAGCLNSSVAENETVAIGDKNISIVFIDADEVRLQINNETTNMLSEGESQVFDDYSVHVFDITMGAPNGTNNVVFEFCSFSVSDVDLYVGNVFHDNTSISVIYCNQEEGPTQPFSVTIEKDENNTYSTGNILSLNGSGCDTFVINRTLVNFSEGDILTVTVDSNDTINETDEENNAEDYFCTGGTCVIYVWPSCSETDGGLDYYVNGSVNYTDFVGGTVISEDVCAGDVVTEYSCNGTVVEYVNYTCPWGCSNGACEEREQVVDYGASKGFAMDYETNLFWQRDSVTGQTWNNARNYCEAANFGGYIDWRLPTIEELEEFYPASVGSTVTSFVTGSAVWKGSNSKIEEAVYSGNAPITAVGMRAKPGDVDRLRVEVRELQGCTLGGTSYKDSGSGLEKWIEAPEGYVVTAVGAGCNDGCNVKNLGIRTRQLQAPCSLGSQVETIKSGSKSPEEFARAPSGYIITGITVRASPGDIRGLKIGYRQIGLLPEEKFMDIEVGDNYWTSNLSGGNAYVLNWNSGAVYSNSTESTASSNSVICVRDGRITPEERVGVGSCQLCMKHESDGTTAASFFGRLFGFERPYESEWQCGGFNDEEVLNDFNCPAEGVFRGAACAVDTDDTLKLKVGCGDSNLQDSCQLCTRQAASNGRDNATWNCAGFNGISLDTVFEDDVGTTFDFDVSANCSDADISGSCQLCRRHSSRGNDWECVPMDGTPLLTDFSSSVTDGYALDLKIRCDIEPAPSCLDTDGNTFTTKGSCTDQEGDINWDYCNGTTLTEFSCGSNFTCESTQVNCPYGCLGGACLQREERNDAYFVINKPGDFELTLNEIVGEAQEVADVDFRNTRFRLKVDLRTLSATGANSGYSSSMVDSEYNVDNYAQIDSITRDNLESYSSPHVVPESVFTGNRFDIDVIENETILDLIGETDNEVYLLAYETIDTFPYSGGDLPVGVIPVGDIDASSTIHSSRTEDVIDDVVSAPTKWSFIDDGYINHYGDLFSVYVDYYGNLTFKHETQNPNSRVVAMVGVLACECSPGEERCDGEDYLSCDDGCGWINNGESLGHCGVGGCNETDAGTDYFTQGTINYFYTVEEDLFYGLHVSTDDCYNETHLHEYSCDLYSPTEIGPLETVECELGCENGACIDCIDSDGKDYSTFGDVQGRDLSGVLFANESDRCLGDTLVERICTNGFLDSTFFECPNGCNEGRCLMVECSVTFGNVSECGKSSYNVDGVLFCDLYNGSKYEFDLYNVSECDLGCSAGVCTVSTCDDNDLGISENVTKSTANDSQGNVVEDVCANDEYLAEAVCKNGVAVAEERYCSRGCQNGKCIGESNCNDTDGGLDYYEAGVVTSCVGLDCTVGENESCIDGVLWESYCGKNNQPVWQQIECPYGCNLSTNRTCALPEEEITATCDPVTIGGPEISPGTRLSINGTLSYCDPFTLTYLAVKTGNTSCINDYECENNVCVEGSCYSIRTELTEQREILVQQATWIQEIRCFLRDLFGIEDEIDCLNESIGG